jgi:hypothetical protein
MYSIFRLSDIWIYDSLSLLLDNETFASGIIENNNDESIRPTLEAIMIRWCKVSAQPSHSVPRLEDDGSRISAEWGGPPDEQRHPHSDSPLTGEPWMDSLVWYFSNGLFLWQIIIRSCIHISFVVSCIASLVNRFSIYETSRALTNLSSQLAMWGLAGHLEIRSSRILLPAL